MDHEDYESPWPEQPEEKRSIGKNFTKAVGTFSEGMGKLTKLADNFLLTCAATFTAVSLHGYIKDTDELSAKQLGTDLGNTVEKVEVSLGGVFRDPVKTMDDFNSGIEAGRAEAKPVAPKGPGM